MRGSVLVLSLVGLAGAAYGISSLAGKASAADQLKLEFASMNITKVSFRDGIKMDVTLNAINSSSYELEFSQPFVQVNIQNNKGGFDTIASSSEAVGNIKLAPRKTSPLKFNLTITTSQATKIPGLVMHMVNAMMDANAPKKNLQVQYGFTALGKNFSGTTKVAV